MTSRFRLGLVLAVALITASDPSQGGDTRFDSLLPKIPSSANVVVLIDVEGMFKSPLGIEQGWAKRYKTDYAGGMVPFPPSVQVVLLAAALDAETLRADWEFTLAKLKFPFSMAELAKRQMAFVEKLDGHSLVTSARRTYFLELVPQTIAVTNHKNRQDMVRWLRFADTSKTPVISGYLRSAVEEAAGKDQYLLAVDLQEALQADEVRIRLEHCKTMFGKADSLDHCTKVVAGLRGLRVSVRVDGTIFATVRVDFSDDLQPLAEIMPRLVLEALQRQGADIEELHRAEKRVEGKSVVLESRLSEPSLRRLISLVRPQAAGLESGEPGDAGATAESLRLAAAQRYFKAVALLLNDLQRQVQKSKNYESSAHWFDSFARQIDQLPTLDVDRDLLAYAGSVAAKLRAISASLRGVVINVKSLEFEKKQEYYVYPGMVSVTPYVSAWSGVGWNYNINPDWVQYKNNFAEVQAAQARVVAEGATDRERLWQLLEDETASMRSKMSKKYNVQF